MNAELTRSDVLRPLIWPNAGLLMLLGAMTYEGGPVWIVQAVLAILCAFMALYGMAYIFFAITDSDALRSEKYKLEKLAIEQGLYGDSSMGLRKIAEMGKEEKLLEVHPVVSLDHD